MRSNEVESVNDRIFVKDLHLRCVIGANDWERHVQQDVLINLEVEADLRPAGASDDLANALDYKTIAKRIISLVETSEYFLVEALAEEIARLCLEDDRARSARVRVEKPGALRFARSVGVEIHRTR